MEAAPEGIDPEEIGRVLASQPGVVEVHDLHVWEVTSGFPALSAHVVVHADDDCHAVRRKLQQLAPSGSGSLTRRSRSITRRPSSRRCRSSCRPPPVIRIGGMKLIKPGPDHEVPRGIVGGAEISQATAGAHNIYMGRFRVPAGRALAPALPRGMREHALHALRRRPDSDGGPARAELEVTPGDMLYVPPRVTHIVENVSDSEPAEYVVARDSPTEDAVVVPWAEQGA